MDRKADYAFEVSWEVCNKVGGIYTVVKSKVIPMLRHYKDTYFVIGPYFNPNVTKGEFKEKTPTTFWKEICESMAQKGILCHFGTWLVEGEPNCILIDYRNFAQRTNDIKKELWEKFGIDSLNTSYHDFDEPIVWSTAVGFMLDDITRKMDSSRLVVHCHEWLSGGALLYLKSMNSKIGTVFTTHATVLGRTLAGNNVDLYGVLDKINPDEKAYQFNIQAKHLMEKACAKNADVFTTVSEITGIEAKYFLGKAPDILLPNGLDIETYPTFDDASVKHKLHKTKMKEFVLYYFFPYYAFDLDNTLFFFISGRYEYRDKGLDVFTKALARLNKMLVDKMSDKTIVAFYWVVGQGKNIKLSILQDKSYFHDIKDGLEDSKKEIIDRIIYLLLAEETLSNETLLGQSLYQETIRRSMRLKKEGLPPVSTHDLFNEEKDLIINGLAQNKLNNKEEDKVKVVYYPMYLTGADQLLDLTYDEAVMATHLGVFPSYYEPWGYTPLETGAFGIASVTTDLAGFGQYINKEKKDKDGAEGIYVIKRLNKNDEEVVEELSGIMYKFTQLSKQERIENKLKAKRLASTADWKILVENYIMAHSMAIQKHIR
ncbi:glycogen/starch synthase [Candidatus Woesearchaeota archaeon]|nr:glycogen/starch synthase [Candidatus Woesearchaeota archaeon]